MILEDYTKTTGWIFYHYRVVVDTHCQQTFMSKQHVKVHFASDNIFKSAKLEPILCLMHFNCAEVVLKSN